MKFDKPLFRKIHSLLGLSSGLLLLVVALTGCIYAFESEISDFCNPQRKLKAKPQTHISFQTLWEIGRTAQPDKHIHAVRRYRDLRVPEVIYFHHDSITHYYARLFVHPETGEIIEYFDVQNGFFRWILHGHMYLWLPEQIGKKVVGIASILAGISVITGFVLWFPKRMKKWKSYFIWKWNWNTKWKRKNADLHRILGVYCVFPVLVFVITGLFWSFDSFALLYYKLLGGNTPAIFSQPTVPKYAFKPESFDRLWETHFEENATFAYIDFHAPEADTLAAEVAINPYISSYYKTDYRFFDLQTLQPKAVNAIYSTYQNAPLSDKIVRANYDIHTGGILGIWGKIGAFLASLAFASLPITGFLFFWGRVRKA